MRQSLVIFFLTFFLILSSCSVGDDDDGDNTGDGNGKGNTNENGSGDNTGGSGGTTDDSSETPDEDKEPVEEGGIIVVCTPGETMECYEGPSGTKGVGICKAGIATCVEDGTDWSECVGQTLPQAEICGDGIDQNCDGEDMTAENAIDYDGDGYTYCDGDCCETTWECPNPERVNPMAFEIPSNGIDDNCNGVVDEIGNDCDSALNMSSKDAFDLGRAIDLCPVEGEKGFGLISARILFPNGNEMSDAGNNGSVPVPESSYAILSNFGNHVKPNQGNYFAMLSTGEALSQITEKHTKNLTESSAPEDWYAFHNSQFPSSSNCGPLNSGSPGSNPVRDSMMLELVIRAPINASAFSIDMNFHSVEFPDYVCKGYNDFFVMLLDSEFVSNDMNLQNPLDKNIAMDELKNPVGVNLAKSGLFKVCKNAVFPPTNFPGCGDDTALQGTGLEGHGATGWLTVKGNINPSEEFKLRMAIWDTGDHVYDSYVILDNLTWYEMAQKPGIGPK
ncbi:MAG: choice-of-anchor L domain-containing protein [bacterium]